MGRRIDYLDDPDAPSATSLVPSVNVGVLNDDGELLLIRRTHNENWAMPGVAAALLHDIGYHPELADTGLHQLDGARWLASEGHLRLAGLVAHHTGASFEADELGLRAALDEFPDEASVASDVLIYCDLTTGPGGERVPPVERILEIEQRYGAESVVARAIRAASEDLFATVERTERRPDRASVL